MCLFIPRALSSRWPSRIRGMKRHILHLTGPTFNRQGKLNCGVIDVSLICFFFLTPLSQIVRLFSLLISATVWSHFLTLAFCHSISSASKAIDHGKMIESKQSSRFDSLSTFCDPVTSFWTLQLSEEECHRASPFPISPIPSPTRRIFSMLMVCLIECWLLEKKLIGCCLA